MSKLTQRLDTSPSVHRVKWGLATLGAELLVNIHVGCVNAEPIPLHLTHLFVLGRSDENEPDIHVNLIPYGAVQKGVSRVHAMLEQIDKTVMLTDLNSTNGTFLNGQRMIPRQRRIVRDEDEIQLGQLVLYMAYDKHLSDFEDARYKAIKRYAHVLE